MKSTLWSLTYKDKSGQSAEHITNAATAADALTYFYRFCLKTRGQFVSCYRIKP